MKPNGFIVLTLKIHLFSSILCKMMNLTLNSPYNQYII